MQHAVAQALLDAQAVGYSAQPITFKSGIKAPVYIDNRRLPFYPAAWHTVIAAMQHLLTVNALAYDVIAGIETAGIPHSAALAYNLCCPSVFVRKQAKEHGLARRIEGGDVHGRRVLLVEDQVTTGGSSLSGVLALRNAGATVTDCLAITSYGFPEAAAAFGAAGVRLHTLTSVELILEVAQKSGTFDAAQLHTIRAWLGDPRGWSERYQAE
ncbi:MAG: orotate phosphoribosyltransferase [Armatimonadetes bacterium]|nr:orotate phosphoribosyltransferase [Anaerolineae bacterium]